MNIMTNITPIQCCLYFSIMSRWRFLLCSCAFEIPAFLGKVSWFNNDHEAVLCVYDWLHPSVMSQASISRDVEREREKQKQRGRQRNRGTQRERHDVEERWEADNINHVFMILLSCSQLLLCGKRSGVTEILFVSSSFVFCLLIVFVSRMTSPKISANLVTLQWLDRWLAVINKACSM